MTDPIDGLDADKMTAPAREILAVLRKYDLAGLVAITDGATVEHVQRLNTDWNCVHYLGRGRMHVKTTGRPDAINPEQKRRLIERSFTAIFGLEKIAESIHEFTRNAGHCLRAVAKAQGWTLDFWSHENTVNPPPQAFRRQGEDGS